MPKYICSASGWHKIVTIEAATEDEAARKAFPPLVDQMGWIPETVYTRPFGAFDDTPHDTSDEGFDL